MCCSIFKNEMIQVPDLVLASPSSIYRHAEMEALVMREINEASGKVSITFDCWTSPNVHGYLCITAHYINKDWELKSPVLAFDVIHGSHTAEALKKHMLECFRKWELMQRIHAITMDNHSTNAAMMGGLKRVADFEWEEGGEVRCVAHVLNLAIRDLVDHDEVSPVMKKGRKFVSYIKNSTLRRGEWKGLNGGKYKLKMDVATRWSSSFYMMKSLKDQRKVVEQFTSLQAADKREDLKFSAYEWSIIEALCEFLEFPAKLTQEAEGDLYSTASQSIFYFLLFSKHVDTWLETPKVPALRSALPVAKDKLDKYAKLLSKKAFAAAFLDPRLKVVALPSLDLGMSAFKEKVRDTLRKYWTEASRSNSENSEEESPKKKKRSCFHDIAQTYLESEDESPSGIDEFERYSTARRCKGVSPLQWWKENAESFKCLARAARDYLPIQATSAAAERAFSSAKRTVPPSRHNLSALTISRQQCLKSWLKEYPLLQSKLSFGAATEETPSDEEDD